MVRAEITRDGTTKAGSTISILGYMQVMVRGTVYDGDDDSQ